MTTVVFVGHQRFKHVGRERHRIKGGRAIQLEILQSHCPDCSRKFRIKTTQKNLLKNGSVNRRCQVCKSPGVRIPATRIKIFE